MRDCAAGLLMTDFVHRSIDDQALERRRAKNHTKDIQKGQHLQEQVKCPYASLCNGHLAGVGLDVFWQEPLPTNDPIRTLPNVIATPHVGGVTKNSFADIANAVASNIERFRRGDEILNRII